MYRHVRAVCIVACLAVTSTAAARLPANRLNRILSALRSSNLKLRLQAVFVLGKLRDARSLPGLVAALNDSNVTIRSLAAYALGQIGSAAARPALRRKLADPSPQVRRHAAAALKRIKSAKRPASPATRARNARFLLKLGPMKVRTGPRGLSLQLRSFWVSAMGKARNVALVSNPRPRSFQKVYGLTSSITQLSTQRSGRMVATTCRVSMVLSTGKGAIVMMGSGGATVQAVARTASAQAAIRLDALKAAIESAKRNLMRYLRTR